MKETKNDDDAWYCFLWGKIHRSRSLTKIRAGPTMQCSESGLVGSRICTPWRHMGHAI
jgi:hypothetical protein